MKSRKKRRKKRLKRREEKRGREKEKNEEEKEEEEENEEEEKKQRGGRWERGRAEGEEEEKIMRWRSHGGGGGEWGWMRMKDEKGRQEDEEEGIWIDRRYEEGRKEGRNRKRSDLTKRETNWHHLPCIFDWYKTTVPEKPLDAYRCTSITRHGTVPILFIWIHWSISILISGIILEAKNLEIIHSQK